jgi:hypothetical protein
MAEGKPLTMTAASDHPLRSPSAGRLVTRSRVTSSWSSSWSSSSSSSSSWRSSWLLSSWPLPVLLYLDYGMIFLSIGTLLGTTKIARRANVNSIMANADNNCYVTYRPSICETFIKISRDARDLARRARRCARRYTSSAPRSVPQERSVTTSHQREYPWKTSIYLQRGSAAPV